MKKLAPFIALISSLAVAVPVYAQSQPLCPPGTFASLCKITPQNGGGVVGTVVQVILIIGALICLFFLIFGGIQYITSGGDKAKVDQARSRIVAALVGLIIALLAFFITNFILVFFTGQGISNLSIPKLV